MFNVSSVIVGGACQARDQTNARGVPPATGGKENIAHSFNQPNESNSSIKVFVHAQRDCQPVAQKSVV